jgi:hypothetical protein
MFGGFQVGPFQPLPAFQQVSGAPQRSNLDLLRTYMLLHYVVSDGTGTTLPNVDYSQGFTGGWPGYGRVRRRQPSQEAQRVEPERQEQIREVAKRDFRELLELQEAQRAERLRIELAYGVFRSVYAEILELELLRLQEEEEAMFMMLVIAASEERH